MKFRVCLVLCMAAAAQSAKVTPMEKVVSLLKDLTGKVEQDGKKDAAQYDKFACFCKEQADEKLYNIEKSQAKIADLKAEIEMLESAIAKLNGEVSKLSKKISGLDTTIKDKTEKRADSHAKYQVKATDMNEAIAACGAAIDALKDSKGAMSGAKLNMLLQVVAKPSMATTPGSVALLSKIQQAPKFEYQGNGIIATLEDLQAEFKQMKKELDLSEFETNSAFETTKLGLSNEKKFAEKEQAEKEALVEQKTETNEAAKSDRDDETADMKADDQFMRELTKQCEDKATLFDQRSSTRADELTALTEATAELEKGAVPNFSANSKLVGLQLNKARKVSAAPASFVQISNVQRQSSGNEKVMQRVRSFLEDAADRVNSRALNAVATRVTLAADHFVKVRGLIKDLIKKLKADAKSEASQKKICDTGMSKAINDRDTANAEIEVANAKITTLTANIASLTDEMETLASEVAALKKELLEATELRDEDKAKNAETTRMAEAGEASVQIALDTLNEFYNNAFLQKTKYTPPLADRNGNTVGDLAPEMASEKYHGSQSESKGIVGILDVILSDFQRTISQTATNEKESQDAFETMEKDTNDSIKEKQTRSKKANGEKDTAEADLLDQEQALSDANGLLDSGLAALEDLEAMCVKGEETYAERVQKRNDEIQALKEAIVMLDEWQN